MNRDLYLTTRETVNSPWGEPVPLTMLNTPDWESCPALSLDEHRLYFTSSRPGGCGAEDIWVSPRHDRRNNFGWETPINLGCDINSSGRELTPSFFEDETGKVIMYFSSNRAGSRMLDVYQAELYDDGTFGPVTEVAALNSPGWDLGAIVRRDGLEVIFGSSRSGGSGDPNSIDFWTATRASTADPWSDPTFVPNLGSPAFAQGRIALSFDARTLYFGAGTGGYAAVDLWYSTREKLHGKGH